MGDAELTLLGWLFGIDTTNPQEQIDESELLKLGVIALLFYGGYRVVKKITASEEE